MPKGIYKRSLKQIKHAQTVNIGREPWNKGRKGLQKAWNKGIKTGIHHDKQFRKGSIPWNKGKKCPVLSGKNSPRWKGGISRGIKDGRKYFQWRSNIFQRDNWTCQTCGKRSSIGEKIYLEAHHIRSWAEFPKLRYKMDNGVTLCKECHKLTDNYKGKNNAFSKSNSNEETPEPQKEN